MRPCGRRRASRVRALVVAVAIGLAACRDVTSPLAPAYDPTQLTNGVIYRWPSGATIAVFVDRTAVPATVDLTGAVARGMAAWKNALGGDQFTFSIASAAISADVIVHGATAPRLVGLAGCAEPASYGAGLTFICPAADSARTLPLAGANAGRVKIDVSISPDASSAGSPLDAIVAHELGHALGIAGHSTDPHDLMHAVPAVLAPSARDIATLRWLVRQPIGLRL